MGLKAMKNNLKGILGCAILVGLLLPMTTMAIALSADSEPATCGPFDTTSVRGFALYLKMDSSGTTVHYLALRLHYQTITFTGQHNSGVIRMRLVDIPTKITGYRGLVYISATFHGSLNI